MKIAKRIKKKKKHAKETRIWSVVGHTTRQMLIILTDKWHDNKTKNTQKHTTEISSRKTRRSRNQTKNSINYGEYVILSRRFSFRSIIAWTMYFVVYISFHRFRVNSLSLLVFFDSFLLNNHNLWPQSKVQTFICDCVRTNVDIVQSHVSLSTDSIVIRFI